MDRKTIIKYLNGNCGDETAREVEKWIESSPENRKTFEALNYFHDVALTTYDTKKENRAGGKNVMLRTALSFAAILVAGLFFGWLISQEVEGGGDMVALHVPAGQRIDICLSDGTTVCLNSEATIEYPARFGKNERKVKVSGEAVFYVEHDIQKPFLIETYAGTIHVLGTRFNVEADESANIFSVALFEGSICFDTADSSFQLAPNERLSLLDGRFVKDTFEGARDYRWTEGIVDLKGLEFSQAMEKLEKSFGVNILLKKDFSGVRFDMAKIMTGDGIDKAMKIMQHAVNFDYHIDINSNTVIIK